MDQEHSCIGLSIKAEQQGPPKTFWEGVAPLSFLWNLVTPKLTEAFLYLISCFYFLLFRAAPVAHGSSQARGQIRAVAAGLCHSHSHTGS